MAQDHLVTIGIRDADLIRSQALKMNKREVPSCCGSHANNITKGLRSGLIIFVKNPTCQPTVDLLQFIVKQVPCRSGLYLKHEANVMTLLVDIKIDGIPYEIDSPFCSVKTTIAVRQSRSIEDREIGKQFAPLWRVFADQLKLLFLDGDVEGAFIVPALDTRSQVLSIKDRRKGIGKPVFKLASLGSGHACALIAPDLSVPGVSSGVLQRVLSQANKANV